MDAVPVARAAATALTAFLSYEHMADRFPESEAAARRALECLQADFDLGRIAGPKQTSVRRLQKWPDFFVFFLCQVNFEIWLIESS